MDNISTKFIVISNKYYPYIIEKKYTILEWFENNYDIEKEKETENINILEILKKSIILINNNNIVQYNTYLDEIFEKLQVNKITIELIPRMKGGGLIDMFMSIIQIGKVFILIGDFIIWLIKFIAWFIFFIIWLLKFLFVDLIVDFYNSILVIIITIFKLPFDLFTALVAFGINSIGGWMTSIFGWDQTGLTKNDKNSNYFKGIDRVKGKKCYLTNSNTVPFSILLGTIICPPLGVFMDLGITGWFNILITIILTLMYYIPGLFYALLVIYS
jgi:uncharacterized membrane protein YqaE (UPF0057 family)